MQFLFFVVCAIAAAAASPDQHPIYAGPQHLPVIGANGVPVDTPAVQQATATHLAHKVEAHARNGDYHHVAAPVVAAPVYAGAAYDPAYTGAYAPAAFVKPEAYPTSHGFPAVTGAGVPLETPEVAAAKTAHFAAHGEALARTGHAAGYHYVAKRGVYTPYTTYTTPAFGYGTYGAYGHHYLAKRQIYTPTAYTTTPFATGAYGHHYLAKRQVYTPTVYSHGYSAYPYGTYY